jgi:EAL domain-containing protein (putative c-di-GMP-specific phosphodiesterase class I)
MSGTCGSQGERTVVAVRPEQFEARLTTAIARMRGDAADGGFAVAIVEFERFRLIASCMSAPVEGRLWDAVFDRLRALLDELETQRRSRDPGRMPRAAAVWPLGPYGPFAILLEGIETQAEAEAEVIALVTALEQPFDVGHDAPGKSNEAIGGMSAEESGLGLCPYAGLAFGSGRYRTATEAINDAHLALCAAAAGGSGCCVTFEPSMRLLTRSKLDTEAGLRRAVACGELVLHYQPIVNLNDGTTAGFEALVRWNHPSRGFVPPGDFIPVAEESGLIGLVGHWVLHEACRQQAKWRAEANALSPVPWVSVNLSRRQLEQPNLVESIARVLRETGTTPGDVHVEITESVIMEAPNALQTLARLREMGLRLLMDDFGTGYSSLACLHQLPLDMIKIDRSFVSRLGQSRDFAAAVHAILSLARNLDLQAIAEGIETPEQVALLQALDCHHGQGYHFAKPMPAVDASRFRIVKGRGSEQPPDIAAA